MAEALYMIQNGRGNKYDTKWLVYDLVIPPEYAIGALYMSALHDDSVNSMLCPCSDQQKHRAQAYHCSHTSLSS